MRTILASLAARSGCSAAPSARSSSAVRVTGMGPRGVSHAVGRTTYDGPLCECSLTVSWIDVILRPRPGAGTRPEGAPAAFVVQAGATHEG